MPVLILLPVFALPAPIAELSRTLPSVYEELMQLASRLEQHYKDVQDFEFTVESGKLFLLQTRRAKRAALASVKTAVDMADEGLISREDAVKRVRPSSIVEMLSPQLDLATGEPAILTGGLPASPGAAVGLIALSANHAVCMARRGEAVILLTEETTADDIHGMAASAGFLTARGGATSHAAVVARGMGKCCITGPKRFLLMRLQVQFGLGRRPSREGDWLSLDGNTGLVFEGQLPMRPANDNHPELDRLLAWALDSSSCLVRANADSPADATTARAARAAGIGLCRTEHMFFAVDRLVHVREMILADTTLERVKALDILMPMQQQDFEALFRTMSPLPVTIRLLDPPLHEFLPSVQKSTWRWRMHVPTRTGNITCARTHSTPCSAADRSKSDDGSPGMPPQSDISEILQMQVRAILQAALTVAGEGFSPTPEIMVPLVASEEEMRVLARIIHETASELFSARSKRVDYKVGTMIELPRAAVCAGPISKHVSFHIFWNQ